MHDFPVTRFRRRYALPHSVGPIVLALMLLVTTALLFAALRSADRWSLDIGPSRDEPFVAGFFGAERDGATTFRWSAPHSQLTLYGAAGRDLAVRLYGDGASEADARRLAMSTSGRPIGTFTVENGWRVYRLLLPPTSDNGVIPLDFASAPHRSTSADTRTLGATAVDWVAVTPPTSGPDGWWAALGRAVALGWMLALVASALVAAAAALRSQPFVVPLWVLLATACAAALLVAWAFSDAATLALAIPTPPLWLLLVATGALGGWPFLRQTTSERRQATGDLIARAWRFAPLLVAILLHLLLVVPLPVGVRGGAALALLSLPGALLALLWFDEDADPLVRTFLGLCGALTLQQFVIFALQALPGPLRWWHLLFANDSILALLIGWQWRHATQRRPSPVVQRSSVLPLLLILLLAGFVRFAALGSAEFQADEIRPMYLAAGILHGQEGILFLHRKGPVEVLLPAGPLVLLAQMSELVARLPFALAGMGVVLGVYLLARSLLGGRSGAAVGIVAAAIVAVDGFLLAFSRIVQYQSVVVLMGMAAIWCAWRCYAGASLQRYLVGAAVFSAMSMLAHYDGIFVVPVLAFVALAACRRRTLNVGRTLAALWPVVVVGLVLLLSFYGPFFFSERFERTTAYLGQRLAEQPAFVATTGGPPFNNLASYATIFSFYNTASQLQWYALVLAAAGATCLVRYVRPPLFAALLAATLAVGCVILCVAPNRVVLPGGGSLAGVPFALTLAALIFAPRTPFALRLLLLWFAPPFLAEAFLIAKPDTHFYNIHAPAALLIGWAVAGAAHWLRARGARWLATPLLAGHALVLLLALPYLNLLFVRQMPEYASLFPLLRPSIYTASYGDTRPAGGTFGFPNRSGWKAVGALYHDGALGGDFESNGMKQIVGWYTRDVFRCYDQPAYFFVDRMPKNPVKIPLDYVQSAYYLFGYVEVEGVRMLDIYSKAPVDAAPRVFDLDDYVRPFDGQTVSDFPTSRLLTNEIVPQQHLVANWQGGVTLRGYDLDRTALAAGETAVMSLYWQAAGPIAPGYTVAVEIADANGRVVGSGTPYCGGDPPEEWYTQYVNDIAFKVTPNGQMPPGSYTLRVGLRHMQSGAWLRASDTSETIPFAHLTVLPGATP